MSRRIALAAATVAVALLAACGGAAPTPVGTPAVTIHVTAANLAFDQTHISVPANVTFAIELDNRDTVPHNVVIRGRDVTRNTDPFPGPQTRTYVYAALPPGSYSFACSIHPEMNGVLDASAASGTAP